MKRQFVETTIFTKRWKELDLTDDDLLKLQNHLMKNPDSGDIIVGSGGARKIRFALPHKGKSGGARVIYVDIIHKAHIHLLMCYPKSKQDNLTEEQSKRIGQLTKSLKGE